MRESTGVTSTTSSSREAKKSVRIPLTATVVGGASTRCASTTPASGRSGTRASIPDRLRFDPLDVPGIVELRGLALCGRDATPEWAHERSSCIERPQARADRVLPAAVPPDPGERRVVGARVHRVDERRPGAAPLPRARPAQLPGDLGFYDLRLPGDPRGAGRAGRAPTASRRSATGTTGSAAGGSSSGRSTRCCESASPTSRSASAGRTRAWTGIWHGRRDRILIEQTYPGGRPRGPLRTLLGPSDEPVPDRRRSAALLRAPPARAPRRRARVTDLWRELACAPGSRAVTSSLAAGRRRTPTPLGLRRDRGRRTQTRIEPPALRRRRSIAPPLRAGCTPVVYRYETRCPVRSSRAARRRRLPVRSRDWDNTPRRGRRGVVLDDATPELFERQWGCLRRRSTVATPEDRLVFVNSWNEWAEGNYLEPDQRWGRAFLKPHVTRWALRGSRNAPRTFVS